MNQARPVQGRGREPRAVRTGLLVLILLVGAGLRFSGLGWGLRHAPDWDERVFVENARLMVDTGSLDQRFYEYPGLFFYVLAPWLAVFGGGAAEPARDYLAARALIACFGVAGVCLTYRLGRHVLEPTGALAAAAFVAVSPLDVVNAHMVRPDIVVASLALLALGSFLRLGVDLAADTRSGLAIGATTAVKFTGALLAPAYLARRLVEPGPRLRGAARAGLLAALVPLAATPYAILSADAYAKGVLVQWTAHYSDVPAYVRLPHGLAYFAQLLHGAFGLPVLALAGLGLWAARPRWRQWLPIVVFVATVYAVHATADRQYSRFLVPAIAPLMILAGAGVDRIGRSRQALAVLLAVLALAWPARNSWRYVAAISAPSPWDRGVEWLEAHAPPHARLLSAVPHLGLRPERFEVLAPDRSPELNALLTANVDYVVREGRDALGEGLLPAFADVRDWPEAGGAIEVLAVPRSRRAAYQLVPLGDASITASGEQSPVGLLRDGNPASIWRVGPRQRGEWIEIRLREPVLLGRVELEAGPRTRGWGGSLELYVSEGDSGWRRVRFVGGRPPVEEQHSEDPKSQVLLFTPVTASRIRIVQSRGRWEIAEMELFSVAPAGT